MAAVYNEFIDRFTIFRTDENDGWLYEELIAGRLRQGWGAPGFSLLDPDGARVERTDWEQTYRSCWDDDPSPRRFAILSRMLEIGRGDVVVVPKMPKWNQLVVAQVASGYRFEHDGDLEDFRHIVHVEPRSIRTFNYRADKDAYLVSGLFARANHRPAVSTCRDATHVEAVLRLMKRIPPVSTAGREACSRGSTHRAWPPECCQPSDRPVAGAYPVGSHLCAWSRPPLEPAVHRHDAPARSCRVPEGRFGEGGLRSRMPEQLSCG